MRIAFLHDRLRPDGATRVFASLGNELTERGHQVYLVTAGRAKGIPFSINFPVIEVSHSFRNTYLAALQSFFLIPLYTPPVDVVIGSGVPMVWTVFFTRLIRRALGIRFIQGDDIGLFDDRTLIKSKILLSIYRLIACISYMLPLKLISNSVWSSKQSWRYAPHRCVEIVHPAVDPNIFKPSSRPSNDIYTIVTLGRRHSFKGIKDVLAALDILPSRIKLVVVSQEDLDLGQHAYPIQYQHPETDCQLVDIYRMADVFVHASWSEGFGMPALEAMACGTPVVLTDSGGVREFAVHEHNCLMSPPRQPALLAKNIQKLISAPDLAINLAKNGILTAQDFTWDKSIEKLENILYSAISGEGLAYNAMIHQWFQHRKGRKNIEHKQ